MRREEDLINAFEADQERITLTLSRKLEQVRGGPVFAYVPISNLVSASERESAVREHS